MKWFYVQPWFEMPRAVEVESETRWTLKLVGGRVVQKGYGRNSYVEHYEEAIELLRGMKAMQIHDAQKVVSTLKAALKEFDAAFPRQKDVQANSGKA